MSESCKGLFVTYKVQTLLSSYSTKWARAYALNVIEEMSCNDPNCKDCTVKKFKKDVEENQDNIRERIYSKATPEDGDIFRIEEDLYKEENGSTSQDWILHKIK